MKKLNTLINIITILILFMIVSGCNRNHSHSYLSEYKSNETNHWKECECGEKSEAAVHMFCDWMVIKEETTTEEGTKERKCSICNYNEIGIIPKKKHTHEYSSDFKSNEKNHWKECECGEKNKEAAHVFGDWVVIKEETSVEDGIKERTCKICGNKEKERIYAELYTKGLSYSLNLDKASYSVTGIGSAQDSDIIIPSQYNNLPVTIISNSAFKQTNITSVLIPSSVKKIGNSAFEECLNLKSVVVLDGVEEIGFSAFSDCSSLMNVILPSNLKQIELLTFSDCDNLQQITIPASVEKISNSAFSHCEKLRNIYYEGTIGNWCNISFDSYSNPMRYASRFYIRNTNNEWEEVTRIEIPNTITKIGNYQFYGFDNVTSITIPNSVTSIGEGAFSNCSSISSITVPDSVIGIDKAAFDNCFSLIDISLPFVGKSINTTENTHFGYIFGADTFEKNSIYVPIKLKEVSIRSGVVKDEAFTNCYNIEALYIFEEVSVVEKNAFLNCFGLKKVQIPTYGLQSLPNGRSEDSNNVIKEIIISGGEYIPNNIFEYFINLKKVEIKEGIESIGDYAFANCSGLNTILLPKSMESTGLKCFLNCNSLNSVYYAGNLEDWCNIAFNEEWSFSNPMNYALHFYMRDDNDLWNEVINIELPTTIDKIGIWQFYGFNHLQSITIPSNITKIEYGAFMGCYQLVEIYNLSSLDIQIGSEKNGAIGLNAKAIYNVLSESSFFNSDELVFFNNAGNYTLIGYIGHEKNLELPAYVNDTVYDVGNYAFEDSNITSIMIPNTIIKMGYRAFNRCNALDKVYYDGTIENWCNISFDAQYSSSNPMNYAEHFYIKDNFNNWQEIEDIDIPSTVKNIGEWQFYRFDNLKSIHIPNSVEKIGYGAFYHCSNLTNLTIENGLTEVDSYAFSNCSNLFSIQLPDSVNVIGKGAFNLCSNLRKVIIGNGVKSIEEEAFFGCERLKEVTIGTAIQTIKNRAFYNCLNLENVSILGNLKSLGEETFYWCPKLTNINLPDSLEEIGSFAFYYCSNLTTIHIPLSLVEIKDNVFNSCYKLNELKLPINIKTIGDSAFAFCYSLEKIDLGALESIEEYAFIGCTNIEYMVLPLSLTKISNNAFAYCKEDFKLYYTGTEADWENVEFSADIKVYFYSQEQPLLHANKFWHYQDNKPYRWE